MIHRNYVTPRQPQVGSCQGDQHTTKTKTNKKQKGEKKAVGLEDFNRPRSFSRPTLHSPHLVASQQTLVCSSQPPSFSPAAPAPQRSRAPLLWPRSPGSGLPGPVAMATAIPESTGNGERRRRFSPLLSPTSSGSPAPSAGALRRWHAWGCPRVRRHSRHPARACRLARRRRRWLLLGPIASTCLAPLM